MDRMDNNVVTISGTISSSFKFDHQTFGEKFYGTTIDSLRLSGVADTINVIVSEKLLDVSQDYAGKYATVRGQFRSHNKSSEGGRRRLVLYVFASDIEIQDEIPADRNDVNFIEVDGYICKEPVLRRTPLCRDIADIILAVNRNYRRSDYLPCLMWGRDAKLVARLQVGTRLHIIGRLQSRTYLKKVSEGVEEERVAYEISVQDMDVVEEDSAQDE